MRCLMCGSAIGGSADLCETLFWDDLLCRKCRKQWTADRHRFRISGVRGYSSYLYNQAFSKCLIQYKELGDEALADVFLFRERKRLRHLFRGRTLVLMPSTAEKLQERGFSHLQLMFGCLGMNMTEPFVKLPGTEQKRLGAVQRKQIMQRIRLKEDAEIPDRIVLCDDLITTGSTLRSALNCLSRDIDMMIYACAYVPEHGSGHQPP
ncbi:MAG: hypothetical protein K6D03_09980 [Solobacterium sp.]|nr:hypothetical protein [Solobacterium sp.]